MLGGKWDVSLKKVIRDEQISEIMIQVSGDTESEVKSVPLPRQGSFCNVKNA